MSHKATEAKRRTIGCELTKYSVALLPSRQREPASLSACLYSWVNTWIFIIWAKFKASEKAFGMELAVWNFFYKVSGYCLYVYQSMCLDD